MRGGGSFLFCLGPEVAEHDRVDTGTGFRESNPESIRVGIQRPEICRATFDSTLACSRFPLPVGDDRRGCVIRDGRRYGLGCGCGRRGRCSRWSRWSLRGRCGFCGRSGIRGRCLGGFRFLTWAVRVGGLRLSGDGGV